MYDYEASNGTLKNRRWSEGSTTIRTVDSFGEPVYFLTYSANKYVFSCHTWVARADGLPIVTLLLTTVSDTRMPSL